jgi:hypothetical protein
MPQYTSTTTTPGGITVNSVSNTENNTITITAATRNGSVGTVTFPANGDLADAVISLRGQLSANEVISSTEISSGIRNAVLNTVNNVKNQATTAQAAATATDTPVPAAPSPPPPVASENNPSPVPPREEEQNSVVVTPLREPASTADEFDGIDQQVADNQNSLTGPAELTNDDAALAAFEEQSRQEAEERVNEFYAENEATSIAGSVDQVRSSGVVQAQRNARQQEDWRVKLQLAPQANYLYNDPAIKQGDLLYPLKATNGVVFPYTPQISTSYRANYDPSDLAHTNYKQYFYKNSSVDDIQITAEFTAQDTTEALYVLAMIHFFRSVTKMFYGQDENPRAGTPPPLCYIFGYGQYQFSDHPLLITSFQYSLPNDVHYIRAGSTTQWAGQNVAAYVPKTTGNSPSANRLFSSGLTAGGISPEPQFASLSNSQASYVPTKLQVTLNAVPIVTRGNIANNFSVKKYASGELFKKGIW